MLIQINSFIKETERLELVDVAKLAQNNEWSNKENPKGGIWENNRLPCISQTLSSLNERVAKYFNDYDSILPFVAILRFAEGGYMSEHIDDYNGVTKFGCVVYLNNDFDGGEIVYPRLQKSFKPNPGTLIIHDSHEPHSVNTITNGDRYMLTTFVFGMDSVLKMQQQ